MYHFTADNPPEPLRLSFRALVPGHIRQYLKEFQLDAIRFMHNFLANGEFCVYNDESGLGKQAAMVVLLDAACSSRKSLIVVQNDERYLTGWEFHFNVLTKTNVTIIKDDKDTTDSPNSVYLAKWSTLRSIDDMSKLKFDFIILDNRGQMLNNSFCTSMLLKHYERKINILISSVDITSDLKLLHNVLRLGGRLDPQYSSFKVFDEKFKLPDAKELAYKRVDLEEYFCKRERLTDYCRAFRLRRYCHQFETQLPLVKEDRYKINLELWREKQNATNSESSSIECVSHQNHENEHVKDTQELFEEYCKQRRIQHLQFQHEEEQRLQQREYEMLKSLEAEKDIIYNVDDEVALINDTPPMIIGEQSVARDSSDEPILMSPLLVESDSSDPDGSPDICNSIIDIEFVDLSSEENEDEDAGNSSSKPAQDTSHSSTSNNRVPKWSRRSELARLEEDIVDALKIKNTSKRLSRRVTEKAIEIPKSRLKEKGSNLERANLNKKTPASLKYSKLKTEYNSTKKDVQSKRESKSKENSKDSLNVPETMKVEKISNSSRTVQISNRKNQSKSYATRSTSSLNSAEQRKNTNTMAKRNTANPSTSKKTGSLQKQTPTKASDRLVLIKQEILEESPKPKIAKSKYSQVNVNSEKLHLKRELEMAPAGIHLKQTRSMQRLTRSTSSKYFTKNLSLLNEKINKPRKKSALKGTSKNTEKNKDKELENNKIKHKDKSKISVEDKTKNDIKNTQASIISQRSSQDYESLQCAQRLSDAIEFLVPPVPAANEMKRNSLIPSTLMSSTGFFTQSEFICIPPFNSNSSTANRKGDRVISISSSDNENSTSQSSSTNVSTTSRRTRALKPKRNLQQQQQQNISEANKSPSFTALLAQQNTRSTAKSPDLFSTCSDLMQLPCTQPKLDRAEPNTPFEGFKIFGSEVKQLQQHYAFNKNNKTIAENAKPKKSYREQRSCLDILEKMFEPSNKKSKQLINDTSCTAAKKSNRVGSVAHKQKTPILPSHPIEAITEARQQQERQKRTRSRTASSTELQDDDIFEITNNGTFGSVMRLHSNGDVSPIQHTPKLNGKQHNKITNYLIGNATLTISQEEPTQANSGNSVGASASAIAGTPNKRQQQLATTVQNGNVKKSPKGKSNSTQTTKLTKWFTKPAQLSSSTKSKFSTSKKAPPTKHAQANQADDMTSSTTSPSPSPSPIPAGKRILKRRRLDLSFNK